jgi:hypothetical protein
MGQQIENRDLIPRRRRIRQIFLDGIFNLQFSPDDGQPEVIQDCALLLCAARASTGTTSPSLQ